MAKPLDEKTQALVDKAAANATKAEAKRTATALKALELEGMTVRQTADIKRAIKTALAA